MSRQLSVYRTTQSFPVLQNLLYLHFLYYSNALFSCMLPSLPHILYYHFTIIHKPEMRRGDMAKRGRPFTYQSEDEKPVTVSLRIPRDLYDRMSRYAARHWQSVTELLLDGLTWRLEQDDPRRESIGEMSYYDNTVLQELIKPAHLLDALI